MSSSTSNEFSPSDRPVHGFFHDEITGRQNVRMSTPEEIAAMDSFIHGKPEILRSDVAANQLALLLMASHHLHTAQQHQDLNKIIHSTQAWKEIEELSKQRESGLVTDSEWLLGLVRHCSWIDAELKKWTYTTSHSKV